MADDASDVPIDQNSTHEIEVTVDTIADLMLSPDRNEAVETHSAGAELLDFTVMQSYTAPTLQQIKENGQSIQGKTLAMIERLNDFLWDANRPLTVEDIRECHCTLTGLSRCFCVVVETVT